MLLYNHFNFYILLKVMNIQVFCAVSRRRRRKPSLLSRRRRKKPRRRNRQRIRSRCRRHQQHRTQSLYRRKFGHTLGHVLLVRQVNRTLQQTNQIWEYLLLTCCARMMVLHQLFMSEDRNAK